MRTLILSALLVVATTALAVSIEAQARAAMPCTAFDRVCTCPWNAVDCVPVCRILPWTGECAPTN
jgi:hypothetical protein